MLVGLDNGGVEQVTLTFSDESDVQAPSFFFLERQYSVQEHDDLISGLDLTKDPLEGGGADGGQLVTVSYDRRYELTYSLYLTVCQRFFMITFLSQPRFASRERMNNAW